MVLTAALLTLQTPLSGWAFGPTAPVGSPVLLDLRSLNEPVAGVKGFVRRSEDGESFVLGDGTPAKFWCANTGLFHGNPEELAKQARHLARIGVNMVRLHASLPPKTKGSKLEEVDREEIDRIQRAVAIFKREGIYIVISPFWAHGGHSQSKATWGLEGVGDGEDYWGLLFFDPKLQAAYRGWIRELYTSPNPHAGGVPLAKEPAVAIAQIQNEDSLLFWTLDGMRPARKAQLAGLYTAWLTKRHGSVAAAKETWSGFGYTGDTPTTLAIMPLWELISPAEGSKAKRMRDQTEFLATTQRDFYATTVDYMKKELGMKTLINASNWTTADNARLGDLERWTYRPGDVVAVNRYTNGGPHLGDKAAWRVDPGHVFAVNSAIREPGTIPTGLRHIAGKPMMITEGGWVAPNRYRAEGPLLVAAYGATTGLDGYFWFSLDRPGFNTDDAYFPYEKLPGDQLGMWKFRLDPLVEASFPAAALVYRTGAVKPEPNQVVDARRESDLFSRVPAALPEGATYDPNRNTRPSQEGQGMTDASAFLLGGVKVDFDGPKVKNLGERGMLGRKEGFIGTDSSQLQLQASTGRFWLRTPQAQGLAGDFAGASAVNLGALRLTVRNRFVAVTGVSMDGKPLKTSTKILIQVGTTTAPTGWRTEPAEFKGEDGKTTYRGERIVNTGTLPWRIEPAQVQVSLFNTNAKTVTALDVEGRTLRTVPTTVLRADSASRRNVGMTFDFPTDTMYVLVR